MPVVSEVAHKTKWKPTALFWLFRALKLLNTSKQIWMFQL